MELSSHKNGTYTRMIANKQNAINATPSLKAFAMHETNMKTSHLIIAKHANCLKNAFMSAQSN